MIGTILHGRWRILSELGRGGMGEVFLAEHVALGRKEAVKILKASLAHDAEFVSRFKREARAVNRLQHPNIVAVYDFGRLDDGRCYLAMEYAEGILLSKLLRRDVHLSAPRALHLLGQLAYAVHHAHSRDVVHRDLKPGNLVVVGAEETLKVLDFGMAKIVAPDLADNTPLSTTNVVWGTPRYMSPERARGIGDDPRSDLYAIGCIGFELLVGSPVFAGSSDQVLHAHLTQSPRPPSTAAPQAGIPPELDAVILRCLEKEPADRFASAAELYAALRKVPGSPAVTAEPRRRVVPVEREHDEPDTHGNARGALRQLAEALLALGAADSRLASAVAYLRDQQASLARLEAAQDALERDAETARAQAGERARLSALRTACIDQVKAAYDALEQLVDELLPGHAGHPTIAPLAERLALVRKRRYPDREG